MSAGAVIVVAAVLKRLLVRERVPRPYEISPVSDGWLAEQRASKTDPQHG